MKAPLHDHAPLIRRRAILSTGGVALIAGALLIPPPPANTPTSPVPVDLRDRWVEIITARAQIDMGDDRVRAQVESQDDLVSSYMRTSANADGEAFFPGYDLAGDDSGAFSGTASRLATMARAWVTPGSRWTNKRSLEERIVEGVERLLDNGYRDGAQYFDNWWDWEIGTPRPLADVACIMRDTLPSALVQDMVNAIRWFIPDPRRSQITDYPSTGANRVNTSRAALIAALVEEDDERVAECIDAVGESWLTVDSGDGFHADGGFIQHLDNPYTGSYGVELLRDAAPLLSLVEESDFDLVDRRPLWDLIDDAYLPVMISGHITDSLRGRAVSRVSTTGSVSGRVLMAAVMRLAQSAPDERQTSWLSLMAGWTRANAGTDLLAGPDVPGAVLLRGLRDIDATAAPEQDSVYFPSMDRLVHRGDGWTAVLAMASNRVAAYEFSEQENVWGARTGNHMRFVYVDDDPHPYDDYYWSTLDYTRPPGTTNHRVELEQKVEADGGGTRLDNEWTAGLVHGRISIAAMHQVPLGEDAPECRRLTVGTPAALVEMVAGIVTEHGPASTAVECRPLGDSTYLTLNGLEVSSEASTSRPLWAHLPGVGGYVFLTAAALSATISTRVGSSRKVLRTVAAIPEDDLLSRQWATLALTHSSSESASDAWVLLPGSSAEETRAFSESPEAGDLGPHVVSNDATAQVLRLGDSIAVAAAWGPALIACGGSLRVRCTHALLMAVERDRSTVSIRVVEPTQHRRTATLSISGSWSLSSTEGIPSSEVSSTIDDDFTTITIPTEGRDGEALLLRLRES